ncbi:hypothetical protein TREMEDRAFT_57391 [Tremella mesenterica DSM 1558]|uniref:uncharacterized protein n=1 Tax=Tremella mesenterica (strain ATCC 24925 / CBS 8224 / DSM 1558 / NBRC 9311 / NRRL Y-6157 / RJB 2259-6 / UBC 559-6) TaxID=578456 RepID=UPI0003F491A0|nr:uncharacterized protein TREMEDRAFT_57391 [Tremella mesenterica DSM 1558]EIW67905.1 hypothetical protein TREMEDRAFT_57391 [Tremella mesenterica DSM 1558]
MDIADTIFIIRILPQLIIHLALRMPIVKHVVRLPLYTLHLTFIISSLLFRLSHYLLAFLSSLTLSPRSVERQVSRSSSDPSASSGVSSSSSSLSSTSNTSQSKESHQTYFNLPTKHTSHDLPAERQSHTQKNQKESSLKHVAFVFYTPAEVQKVVDMRWESFKLALKREKVLVECVRRAITWSAEEGVEEVSFHTGSDMGPVIRVITREMTALPPSPPASGSSTPRKRPISFSDDKWLKSQDQDQNSQPPVISLTVCPPIFKQGHASHDNINTEEDRNTGCDRRLVVHVLNPGVDRIWGEVTTELSKSVTTSSDVDQERLDQCIRERIPMSDPDLLILHPITPVSTWKALFPIPAPELRGYPFWFLRITEIYQHPTSLPFHIPTPLVSLLRQARDSALPAVQKIARRIPLPPPPEEQGVIQRDEWEGALRAYRNVEQRLGR